MANNTDIITSERLLCGISDGGQIMGQEDEGAFASIEKEGTYEHLAVGDLEEGYTLAYRMGSSDYVKYDVYGSNKGIEINSASSIKCVVTSTVTPCVANMLMRCQNSRRVNGSTPEVGSSRKRMAGSCISAQASASRCL